MSKVKLKAAPAEPSRIPEAADKLVPLPPLNVSGVVVKKKDLVAALRIFVPLLTDIKSFEGEDEFYLVLDGPRAADS